MVRVPGTVAGTGGRGGTISEDRTSEDGAAVVCEERTTGGAVLHRGIGRAGYISENGRGKGGQLFVQVLPEDRRTAAKLWTPLFYFGGAGHVSEKVLLGLLGRLLGYKLHYRPA